MSVNPKHDRQGVRTATDIERKYILGDRAELLDLVTNANRTATSAQAVAVEAYATATQATETAEQAVDTANEAVEAAATTRAEVAALSENVYTKDQTLSSAVKGQLGLADTATPSDAFAALNLSAGKNIKIEGNVISVITTDEAEGDNTLPITSAGVYTQIGNIAVLLGTI